ncbi:glycine--tRNA ligase subunit beta [Trichlorobacter ammonificans]|uniref:Glycine--tRNA ligase beta subunit n=1 Tax=Trichlorobacter ammonificans TaxID=2916410 RepID=A0ABM9D9E1_9BACT|nr:glycine--tRNA ligase subunit beta [Trichlorobacter ammonificans]CAH2031846.1 Glycine--tRNA ligase beta subunit [Trichlorobacter ammonificans]
MSRELLLEIGAEEIPAGFVPKALSAMEEMIRKELAAARLEFSGIRTLGTPRRLTLVVQGLPALQPDAEITAMGPSKKAAFDAEGKPTKAAEGFARGQGVTVAELQVVDTDKGEYLAVTKKESGRPTHELLAELLPRLIATIPFKKSMRWADLDVRFARPVHWIVALFDGSVIPFAFGPIQSGNISRGHRFMANQTFPVRDFAHYQEECERHFVIVDQERRKETIRRETHRAAKGTGGQLLPDEALLDEVTYLVEYPSAIVGTIPAEFLVVPKEVLITSMRSHQRYFSVVDEQGKLLPYFITIPNTVAEDPSVVVKGNERVLRARLSDARFFFEEDQKVKLATRVESLKSVIYQQKLGTSYEKMERFRRLAGSLARQLNPAVVGKVHEAAYLCKADLVSGMVGEFPEVQGIMGREYALLEGIDPEVANAIAEHYLPTQAGGDLPASDVGAFVSIADKLDSICGCFSVGLIPTGSADPYALRRAAIGIINIVLDRGYRFSLSAFVTEALQSLATRMTRKYEEVHGDIIEFFRGRFINLLAEQYPADVVDAAVAAGFDDLADVAARITALSTFRLRDDYQSLTAAFKRVCNIVKDGVDAPVLPDKFQDEAEHTLYKAFQEAKVKVDAETGKGAYLEALTEIAAIKWAIDGFFDAVMVMADDQDVRGNRLALLTAINRLFGKIADFSRLSA